MQKEIFKYRNRPGFGHFPIKYISNKRDDNNTGLICESKGILEYDNAKLHEDLYEFVQYKLRPLFISNSGNFKYDSAIKDIYPNKIFKKLSFYPDLTWLDRIDIYLTKEFPEDCMLLGTVTNDNKKVSYDITYKETTYPAFVVTANKINYMSIVLSLPDGIFNSNDIVGIILHEMRHWFDFIPKHFNSDELNRDINFFHKYAKENEYITEYWNYSKEERDEFIHDLTVDDLFTLICDMMYYLNLSEIRARLVTFAQSVDEVKSMGGKKYHGFGADSIAIYTGLYNMLRAIRKGYSKDKKDEFAKKYNRLFERVYNTKASLTDENSNENVKKKFRHYGKYDYRAFDYLMTFYISRIRSNFIYKAEQIYYDKLGKYLELDELPWNRFVNYIIKTSTRTI